MHLDRSGYKGSKIQFNPFGVGTTFMLMLTGWFQSSRRVTRQLALDPTCLLLGPPFPIKIKPNLKVLKSRRQYNLFLENYPAFKGLITSDLEVLPQHVLHFQAITFFNQNLKGILAECPQKKVQTKHYVVAH